MLRVGKLCTVVKRTMGLCECHVSAHMYLLWAYPVVQRQWVVVVARVRAILEMFL